MLAVTLYRWRAHAIGIGAGLLVFIGYPVHATPTTLVFSAEINRVPPGIPFDSDITFQVGDIVRGQFTFEPAEDHGNNPFSTVQFDEFLLSVNGAQIVAPSYQLRSWNDNGITDFPPATVVDDLSLEGAELVSPSGEPFRNINPALSAFRISLLGHSHLIAHGVYPNSVATWNAFDLERQLTLTLRDGNGGAVGFQATIGDFMLIPEPRASTSVFVLVCAIFAIQAPAALRTVRVTVRNR